MSHWTHPHHTHTPHNTHTTHTYTPHTPNAQTHHTKHTHIHHTHTHTTHTHHTHTHIHLTNTHIHVHTTHTYTHTHMHDSMAVRQSSFFVFKNEPRLKFISYLSIKATALHCQDQSVNILKENNTDLQNFTFFSSRNEMSQFLCKLSCWTRKSQW